MTMTDRSAAAAPPERRLGKRVLGTLFLVVFVDLVGFGMIVTLLVRYGEMYHANRHQLALLAAAYSAMQFLFAPILGRLSDRFGRRPVLLLSLVGSIVGYVLLGVAGSLTVLFASRLLAGACAGNIATAQAVVADVTGPAERARGMGMIGAAIGLGFILGPAIGGFLFVARPWLPGFAAAATSLVAFLMVATLLPETRVVGGRARPGLNAASLARALAHPLIGVCIAGFFLATYAFANFENGFILYTEHRFGLTARGTGLIFFWVGLIGALLQGGLTGRLVKRWGEAVLVAAGLLLGGLGLLLLPLMPSVRALSVELVLLAVGIGLLNPSLSALTSRLVDQDEQGGTLGIYQGAGSLARVAGQFTGVYAFEVIGFGAPFWIGAALYAIAWIMSLVLLSRMRSAARAT